MVSLPYPLVTDFEGIQSNFETLGNQGFSVGPGAPTPQTPPTFYFRTDTPTTANQRVYVFDASTSTWTGIL